MPNRLKSADLYSPGFLFLVQLDLVRRSTEASFDSTHVEFQARCVMLQYDYQFCCVMLQYDHQFVAPPQMIALSCVLHANWAQNLSECDVYTLR